MTNYRCYYCYHYDYCYYHNYHDYIRAKLALRSEATSTRGDDGDERIEMRIDEDRS